jgi:hypothetical protein
MHRDYGRDDLWIEFRKRRDEWRSRRAAYRRAWRGHGHDCGWGGMHGAAESGAQADGGDEAFAARDRVAEMEKTIQALSERVKVLERLAVDDEAHLAAEIEKLKRDDGDKSR